MMESTDDRTSFVPPLALAALIPWFALAIYRTLGAENRADGTAIATISGTLIAILLLGVGLPYLVYRLTKKSTRAAIITLLIVAVLGLAGEGVNIARANGLIGGGSSKSHVVTSAALSKIIRESMTSGDEARSRQFYDDLEAELPRITNGLTGDELIETEAFHEMMAPYWRLNHELSKMGWIANEHNALPTIKSGPDRINDQIKSTLQRSTYVYSRATDYCEGLIKTIDQDEQRAIRSMVKAGYSESKATKIAKRFARETNQDERRALAQADLEYWHACRLLVGTYWSPISKGVKARDDQGRQLSTDIARPRHLDEVKEAEAKVNDAINALRQANEG